MTAPARSAPAATTTTESGMSALLEKVIERTIESADARKRIAEVLPRGRTFDLLTAEVREAMIRTPKLADCDPDTIISAIVKSQQMGLEIGETVHLVPFKDKTGRLACKAIRDYKGDIQLLIANHVARDVSSECVYSNEPFRYVRGTNPTLEHTPLPPSRRGEMIGAYAVVWLSATMSKTKFLWLEEIEQIRRDHSQQWTQEKVGDCPSWYAMKCAVKAATKLLPKSQMVNRVRAEMTADEEEIAESVRRAGPIATTSDGAYGLTDRPPHITADGEDTRENGGTGGEARSQSPAPQGERDPAPVTAGPACPKCGGTQLYDNRAENAQRVARGEKARPDFKCRKRDCDGVIWPPKPGVVQQMTAAVAAHTSEEPPPHSDEDAPVDTRLQPGAVQSAFDMRDERRPRSAQSQGR